MLFFQARRAYLLCIIWKEDGAAIDTGTGFRTNLRFYKKEYIRQSLDPPPAMQVQTSSGVAQASMHSCRNYGV